MRHSKKKVDETSLPEQDAMGSEDDFAPGGSDASADARASEGFQADGESGDPSTDTTQASSTGNTTDELSAERERYLRLAAEYDNYRKRSTKERQDAGTRAQADLVR